MNTTIKLDWSKELEKTVVSSLATTFGLDFLLLQDKKGGDVDTVHNARQGIYATKEAKDNYDNRPDYKNKRINSAGNEIKEDPYHTDHRFRQRARADKNKRLAGELHDAYRNTTVKVDEKTQLDHVISSSEIHNDAGRILAGTDGVELSLQDSNLCSTDDYINNKKQDMTMKDFIEKIPEVIKNKEASIKANENRLKSMASDTLEQKHKKRMIEDEIRKEKEQVKALSECDTKAMMEADKKARQEYNKKINFDYYSSSKFLKNTAISAGKVGVQMGARQALGLVLAEIWFELREEIPRIHKECKDSFTIEKFLSGIIDTLKNIWKRVKDRFSELLTTFKDSAIGGAMASITTTLLNIFLTTQKMVGKLIREMFNSIVSVVKLIFFNPDNLTAQGLFIQSLKIISAGVSVILGTMIYSNLATVFTFPFGSELAAFLSAVATGIMTLAFGYFIDNSKFVKNIAKFLESYKDKYALKVEYMKKVNAELDRYLAELAKIELNMNVSELQNFANNLVLANTELEKHFILKAEIERRNIELPYEQGNKESFRNWLASKCKK